MLHSRLTADTMLTFQHANIFTYIYLCFLHIFASLFFIFRTIRFSFAMMTSSNGNIFRATGPLCGEFTGSGEFHTQRPVTRSFGVFFDLRLNKRLSKQLWGWWFETPAWSLWRHRNGARISATIMIMWPVSAYQGYSNVTKRSWKWKISVQTMTKISFQWLEHNVRIDNAE